MASFIKIPSEFYISGALPFAEASGFEWNINMQYVKGWFDDTLEKQVLFSIDAGSETVLVTFSYGPWMDQLS